MDHGQEMKMIVNLPEPVFWLWLSGAVFIIMALVLLIGPYNKERNELMTAFLGFLIGMGLFHILGGASMLWGKISLMYLAAFAAVTGSAFVLKFPLTAIGEGARRTIFYIAMLAGWVMIISMILLNSTMDLVMRNAAIYMIIVSGAISGFYMVAQGFRINDPSVKLKCIGGGCSIIFCCLLTHLIVILIGMTALAKLFMVLTPITLVLSVVMARRIARTSTTA